MTNNFNLTKNDSNDVDYSLENKDYFHEILNEMKSFQEKDALSHLEIKKTTKYLVNSFNREEISRETLEDLLKILLSSYVQLKFDEKFLKKKYKFYRLLPKSIYFERENA
ncbi:MAG: hypothetical protein WC879_06805 [Melioribacteraceae bacterium]